jgi:hypothetical protein
VQLKKAKHPEFDSHFLIGLHGGLQMPAELWYTIRKARKDGTPVHLVIIENYGGINPDQDPERLGFLRAVSELSQKADVLATHTGLPVDDMRGLVTDLAWEEVLCASGIEPFDQSRLKSIISQSGIKSEGVISRLLGQAEEEVSLNRQRLSGLSSEDRGLSLFSRGLAIVMARCGLESDVIEGRERLEYHPEGSLSEELKKNKRVIAESFYSGAPMHQVLDKYAQDSGLIKERFVDFRDDSVLRVAPRHLAGIRNRMGVDCLNMIYVYGLGHESIPLKAVNAEGWENHNLSIIQSSTIDSIISDLAPRHQRLLVSLADSGKTLAYKPEDGQELVFPSIRFNDMLKRIKAMQDDEYRLLCDKLDGVGGLTRYVILFDHLTEGRGYDIFLYPKDKDAILSQLSRQENAGRLSTEIRRRLGINT